MIEQATYNKTYTSTLQLYREGWNCLILNWRVLFLLHGLSFLMVFIALGPLSNLLKKVVEKTNYHEAIAGPFDYTLLMDIINNHGEALKLNLTLLLSFVIPFFLWLVFSSGGMMQLIKHYPRKVPLTEFWKGGAEYSFRFLRLGSYTLSALLILCAAGFVLFSAGGLSPFELESESILITKFWILLAAIGLGAFLISIFKEIAKAKIASNQDTLITKANLAAAAATFSTRAIGLGLVNLLVLIGCTLLYLLIKKLIGHWLIVAIIIGQVFLILRMALRFIMQASFYFQERANVQA